MSQVAANDGSLLNSEYLIDSIDGHLGLILESWGPSDRNADYNLAIELLIHRLILAGYKNVGINVISRDLIAAFPAFADRSIAIGEEERISLTHGDPTDIRLEIGRKQAALKVDPNVPGGNRTKRILLYRDDIESAVWRDIAEGNRRDGDANIEIAEIPPSGNMAPTEHVRFTSAFKRNSRVRAWVFAAAEGNCDLCGREAPFIDTTGQPFLEVHHVIPLSQDGADTIWNTVAVCPNCHRELHFGEHKTNKQDFLFHRHPRLKK